MSSRENIRHRLDIGDSHGGNYTTIETDGDIKQNGTATATLGNITSDNINTTVISFDPTYTGNGEVEGDLYWDADDQTLNVVTGLGNIVQVGQEVFGIGVNKTGAQLDDGTCVYGSGVQGNRMTMSPADASDLDKSTMVGVVTSDVADNAEGPVTTFGIVRGYNTSSYTPGTKLYLTSDASGDLTDTVPPVGSTRLWVATTLNQTTNGSIFVNPKNELRAYYETYGGSFGDVDAGDYSTFEDDGTLKFTGDATVFLDEFGPLIGQRLESPSSDIIQNNAEGSLTFKTSATLVDYVTMTIQFNHDRKAGATVYPHIHWWQTSSDVPNWLLQYRWQRNGEAKVTSWTDIVLASHAFTYTSGTLNQISGTSAGIAPPSGDGVSTILQCRLLRDTANTSTLFAGADPLAATVDAVSMDVHKEIDTIGSRQEYIK